MKFRNLFSFRSKPTSSVISNPSTDDESDYCTSVHLASGVVPEYGAVLEENAIHTVGMSERRLPYSKKEIEAAIERLLTFLHNEESWCRVKQEHPRVAAEMMTDRYYKALRLGYVELAKFLPDDEAERVKGRLVC